VHRDPRLKAGMVVTIEGLGRRFSGRYYLYLGGTPLSRQRGYRTAFSARRNST
jgi:hypothetical protein